MIATTEPAPLSVLRRPGAERRLVRLLHPRLASILVPGVVALTAVLLYTWWPAGVAVGFAACTIAVLAVGIVEQRAAGAAPVAHDLARALGIERRAEAPQRPAEPSDPEVPDRAVLAEVERAALAQHEAEEAAMRPVLEQHAATEPPTGVPADDVERIRVQLGDDFEDFARAARLVVATQYASAARLQRELGVPYTRARRLLDGLEAEHFVGPATGSLPRQVRVPKEKLADLERLLELA